MADKNDLTPFLILGGLGVVAYFLYENGTLASWFPSLFGPTSTPAPSPSTGQIASTPPSTPPSTAGASTSASSTPSYPLGVSIQNTSGGSATAFNVGDGFSITVTGPPNQPVTSTAQFGAQSQGPTSFGNTNAQGQLVITGSMPASDAGSWIEEWFVGGQSAGQLSFAVNAAGTSGLGAHNFFGHHSRVKAAAIHGGPHLRVYRGGR